MASPMHSSYLPTVASTDLTAIRSFAIAMGGLIMFFSACNVFQQLSLNGNPHQRSWYMKGLLMILRFRNKVTIKKVPGFTSAGHLMLITVYVGINLVFLFTNIDWSSGLIHTTGLDSVKRLGWLTVANMALVFFLGLKNTPLSLLTAYSYEKLNGLHQVAGYTTVVLAMVHGVGSICVYYKMDLLFVINVQEQRFGIAAGTMMLVIGLSSRFLMNRRYEVFYVLHILLVIGILVSVYFHRPWINTRTCIVAFFCAGLLVLDKSVRYIKYLWYGHKTLATLSSEANGSTRIVYNRSLTWARPGSHAFLWIPGVKTIQTHPCTLTSVNPATFIITSRTGFTKDLYTHTSKASGKNLFATFDAPYGTPPRFEKYERVLLLAGGSGATWTFAVALDMLSRSPQTMIEFVWVVRDTSTLSWFEKELLFLHQSANVNIRLHSTGPTYPGHLGSSPPSSTDEPNYIEKEPDASPELKGMTVLTTGTKDLGLDVGLGPLASPALGRPDLSLLTADVTRNMKGYDRICVGVCGPTSMLNDMRNVVSAANKVKTGPIVDIYVETYGW